MFTPLPQKKNSEQNEKNIQHAIAQQTFFLLKIYVCIVTPSLSIGSNEIFIKKGEKICVFLCPLSGLTGVPCYLIMFTCTYVLSVCWLQVVQVQGAVQSRELTGSSTPVRHCGHVTALVLVPNSVGSEQRSQQQSKYQTSCKKNNSYESTWYIVGITIKILCSFTDS